MLLPRCSSLFYCPLDVDKRTINAWRLIVNYSFFFKSSFRFFFYLRIFPLDFFLNIIPKRSLSLSLIKKKKTFSSPLKYYFN